MNDKDKEAFERFVNDDDLSQMEIKLFRVMSEEQKIMFCSERTWQAACEYKEKQNTDLIMKLQMRIESLIAENAKLFEEAKRELAYKDKKIAYLEAECEMVYHPIREFWNQERVKPLIEALEKISANLSDDYRYDASEALRKYREEV
jgi:FtsZ-binding cell division protein ZapB